MSAMPYYGTQSNYKFTHTFCLTCGAHVFQRGQRNDHAYTFKFTRLQNTHDSYTGHFHTCAIHFRVSQN